MRSRHIYLGNQPEGFKKWLKMIGVSEFDEETTITLAEVVLDDNLLMMALTVESDFLAGYEKLNENDYQYNKGELQS